MISDFTQIAKIPDNWENIRTKIDDCFDNFSIRLFDPKRFISVREDQLGICLLKNFSSVFQKLFLNVWI